VAYDGGKGALTDADVSLAEACFGANSFSVSLDYYYY